jgi:NADH:ubiquinone oxidoreductase subunit 4 (subunit M)
MVGLISALILIPLVGALALFIAPERNARPIALLVNALAAFDALVLWRRFDIGAAGIQMLERTHGFPQLAPNIWSGSTV